LSALLITSLLMIGTARLLPFRRITRPAPFLPSPLWDIRPNPALSQSDKQSRDITLVILRRLLILSLTATAQANTPEPQRERLKALESHQLHCSYIRKLLENPEIKPSLNAQYAAVLNEFSALLGVEALS
jgi:hypothetical protein